jgi:hypothetical protein
MTNLTTEQIEDIKNDFDKWFTKEQEKKEIVDKIDKQIEYNEKKEKIIEDFSNWYNDKKQEKKDMSDIMNAIDDKMIELALNDKSTIYLGKLKFNYDEKCKWYEAVKEIDGKEVSIHSYGLNEIEKVLKLAVKYYEELDLTNLKNYIADNSYEQDKYEWQFENITKDEFIKNLTLVAIEVDTRRVEYWFDDNDMYGGHSITVRKKHDDDKMKINLEG